MHIKNVMLRAGLLAAALFAEPAYAAVADHVEARGDRVVAYTSRGQIAWQWVDQAPVQVHAEGHGTYLVNGHTLLNSNGRVLKKWADGAGVPAATFSPADITEAVSETWSTPVDLLAGSLFTTPVVFDDSGNAWVGVSTSTEYTQVLESVGSTGIWNPVGAPLPQAFWGGTIDVDAYGDVTLVCYCRPAGDTTTNVEIQAGRYEPATGWTLKTLYDKPETAVDGISEQDVFVAADAAGNAIVAADLNAYGAASFVYSNTSKSWSGPQALPLPYRIRRKVKSVTFSDLARSADRTHIVYAYNDARNAASFKGDYGFYLNYLDTSTLKFGNPIQVPNTADSSYYVNANQKVPLFVDNSGTATIIWENTIASNASRYSGSAWTSAVLSTVHITGFDGDFSTGAIDPSGDIFLAYQGSLETGGQAVVSWEYRNGIWSSSQTAAWNTYTDTRERIAWLGTTGNAVVVYNIEGYSVNDYAALSSSIWNGSSWSAATALLPEGNISLFMNIASDTNGNVALVYNPECPSQPVGGVCVVYDATANFMDP